LPAIFSSANHLSFISSYHIVVLYVNIITTVVNCQARVW